MMHILKERRGFTLLIAVIVSGILISLGSAIFDLVSKEILLSSSGRESQFAFYAADTGVECALYYDQAKNAFSSTSPSTTVSCGGGASATVNCSVAPYANCTPDTPGSPTLTATFPVAYDSTSASPCVTVQVTKTYSPTLSTTIQAYGHNTCTASSQIRLERAIKVSY